ncbi:RmlC-like cupin domain-containing protein [Naematelia encephala]|uniref:RmlC-like cupin domain-containing protein n=1 Tax=Naematelia encephala TaxID=71784 RepID=A0A1Y2APV2_9TREE|nr:RmlC-like cupin domain-containing protein [Naematelia encephala]
MPNIANGIATSGPLCPPPTHEVNIENDSQEQLLKDIETLDVQTLWTRMAKLNPPSPAPKAIAYKWEYSTIRPYLIRAGQLVTEKEAERRVLMLINPEMNAPCTTDTLYAGLQLVMPGETAPAHRHTAFACRFIIEGNGGFTAIQGKRIKMHRGDFILTPTWRYHDHGNDSSATPMIWLDGLDLPQFQHFPVHFVQHYSESRYPAKATDSSTIVFPWVDMQAKLDATTASKQHSIVRYTSQEEGEAGQDVSKIIGAQCERLEAGANSEPVRETTSAVYHIIDGKGRSVIGNKVIEWVKGDTFSLPSWHTYHHEAEEKSYLYRFDDRPMITSLGFYRNETEDFMNEV